MKLMIIITEFNEDDLKVDPKYYLGKKGFEFVTNPKYKNRAQVNSNIMQCQKANQQFNWNGEFVFVPYEKIKDNADIMNIAYISTYNGKKGACRKLTPLECTNLMGFSKKFKFPKAMLDKDKYRQAGNSIVVNIFEKIIPNLIDTGAFKAEELKAVDVIKPKLKLATLFSGIGAIEQALIRNNTPYEIVFACDKIDPTRGYDSKYMIDAMKKDYASGFKLVLHENMIYLEKKKFLKKLAGGFEPPTY